MPKRISVAKHLTIEQLEQYYRQRYRLGLKPVVRRVYVPEAENPIANVNWQFKWLWLYAFVRPLPGGKVAKLSPAATQRLEFLA